MKSPSRREMIKASAAASALLGLGVAPAFAKTYGTDEDVRLGVIGTGGRGGDLINSFVKTKGARIVSLCDAEVRRAEKRAAVLSEETGSKVDSHGDYRKLLERDDIDAVIIAAPNHWHALMTIHACQAGKHVYTEKPVCHTVWEGRKMVEAAKVHDRIVQGGFQNRSDIGLREAIPMIHDGTYGKITQARGLCYRNRASIGKRDTPLTPPAELNYDLWLGPAADLPIMRPNLHYDWHWDYNTGNGDMGNQGPHELDLLRWALGDPMHPVRVQSFGGRFAWNDAGNTCNLQSALFDFGNDIPTIFEVKNIHLSDQPKAGAFEKGPGVGIIITMENAEFRGGRGGGSFYDPDGQEIRAFKGDSGRTHQQNFIDAVRAGDAGLLRTPLESAYYSSCMAHLANNAARTGRQANTADVAEVIGSSELGSENLERFAALLDILDVDTNATPWQVSAELTFDNEREQFVAGEAFEAASALLRRNDRKPYEVPESV